MPTIGVSIAVPEPFGSHLQDYRVALGDHAGRQIPTHITLVPPYEVVDDALTKVQDHLLDVTSRHRPFEVHLRGTGTFRPVSPVVFVGVAQGISDCEMLAADLRTGPLAVDTSYPYHPHVTIGHQLDDAALDRGFNELSEFEAGFLVDEVWLYLHDADQGWQPSSPCPLTGA